MLFTIFIIWKNGIIDYSVQDFIQILSYITNQRNGMRQNKQDIELSLSPRVLRFRLTAYFEKIKLIFTKICFNLLLAQAQVLYIGVLLGTLNTDLESKISSLSPKSPLVMLNIHLVEILRKVRRLYGYAEFLF